MISIICVYNNKTVFTDYLLKSIEAQQVRPELIALDNSASRFGSAAQALNHGARLAQADSQYLLFAHQDISFDSASWLHNMEEMVRSIPNLGIAGIAGCRDGDSARFSNITHGTPPRPAGVKIHEPMCAMTVDECCVVIPRRVFENHTFDEAVCNGWHFYAVEYCLRMKQKGLGVYILPVSLHHGSLGTQDKTYFSALERLLEKYRGSYKKIHTTCGCWGTRMPARLQMGWHLIRKIFYAVDNAFIAWGLMPAWLMKENRKKPWSKR